MNANQAVIDGATLVYKGNQLEYVIHPGYYLISPLDKNLLSTEEFKRLPIYTNFKKAVEALMSVKEF
jgi:hypothetical protein